MRRAPYHTAPDTSASSYRYALTVINHKAGPAQCSSHFCNASPNVLRRLAHISLAKRLLDGSSSGNTEPVSRRVLILACLPTRECNNPMQYTSAYSDMRFAAFHCSVTSEYRLPTDLSRRQYARTRREATSAVASRLQWWWVFQGRDACFGYLIGGSADVAKAVVEL